MKYSKRDREKAAIECAINASNRGGLFARFDHRDVRHSINATQRSGALANAAFHRSLPMGSIAFRDAWAEAEAMIRTGWGPS